MGAGAAALVAAVSRLGPGPSRVPVGRIGPVCGGRGNTSALSEVPARHLEQIGTLKVGVPARGVRPNELAWNDTTDFIGRVPRSRRSGRGVLPWSDRGGRGSSYSLGRGEIRRSRGDDQRRKQAPRTHPLVKNES